MEWMLLPLKRYADFEGRSRRMEYWMFQLGQAIFFTVVTVLLFMIAALFGGTSGGGGAAEILIGIFAIVIGVLALALLIPALAVQVRRLHDQSKSGWWILISFVPFGGFVLLYFMFVEGDRGDNQYGPDPKATGEAETFT